MGIGARGLQEWFPANKGHFSVVRGTGLKTFTLEVRRKEDFDRISEVLTENGIEFDSNYGSLINVNY